MSEVVQWMTDIAQAAEDLGYAIEELRPGEIRLLPLNGSSTRDTVTIESVFLSGDHLRRVLQPVRVKVPA